MEAELEDEFSRAEPAPEEGMTRASDAQGIESHLAQLDEHLALIRTSLGDDALRRRPAAAAKDPDWPEPSMEGVVTV